MQGTGLRRIALPVATETVTAGAGGFGNARFVVLGATGARGNITAANVTAANVTGTDVPDTVARIVADAVR